MTLLKSILLTLSLFFTLTSFNFSYSKSIQKPKPFEPLTTGLNLFLCDFAIYNFIRKILYFCFTHLKTLVDFIMSFGMVAIGAGTIGSIAYAAWIAYQAKMKADPTFDPAEKAKDAIEWATSDKPVEMFDEYVTKATETYDEFKKMGSDAYEAAKNLTKKLPKLQKKFDQTVTNIANLAKAIPGAQAKVEEIIDRAGYAAAVATDMQEQLQDSLSTVRQVIKDLPTMTEQFKNTLNHVNSIAQTINGLNPLKGFFNTSSET